MTTSTMTAPGGYRETQLRPEPRLGGLNPTLVRIELLRVLRNRRTLLLSLALPVVLFLMVGGDTYRHLAYGRGTVAGMIMAGMALYGAMVASASAGAAVSVERAAGWSRQLRLTPLSPVAYVVVKAGVGMITGALSVFAVVVVGSIRGLNQPVRVTVACAVLAWLGSTLFGAFGLFMGYLLPSENAMQFIGIIMVVFAFLGGLFTPVDPASTLGHIARFTPMWGIHQLTLLPFGRGGFGVGEAVNIVAWLVVFIGGAAWRMSRDTARV